MSARAYRAKLRRNPDSLEGLGIPDRVKVIIQQVASDHDTTCREIIGPRSFRRIAYARFDAIHRVRLLIAKDGLPLFSTTQIGHFFGNRDHSTVIYAVRRWGQIVAAETLQQVQAA